MRRPVNLSSEVPLSTSLLLICAAATRSSRVGGFPRVDEPLDDAGRSDAAALILPDRFRARVVASPARSAMETADAMGVEAVPEQALRDMDHGRWAGQRFTDVEAYDGQALIGWLSDPTKGCPDGESMEQARQRVAPWVDGLPVSDGAICAISHAMTIRVALAHMIDMPLHTTLAIDIAPLSRLHLSFHGRWRLQALERA